MAPQPDNDNTPKAPDKNDKTKGEKNANADTNREKNKDFKTLNNLNDCELKDLLDEAITYKNPKDREGKSTLFKELLSQAEESERNARAASAGGSEQVRYCNTSAKRSKHRRKPNSISENVMHGGSLDNLAKEDLFEVAHHLSKPKRTVSARQREGGSLPSNVNAGGLASYDPHFLEEARRKRTVRGGGPPEPMEIDMETASLLDHDSVAENYERGAPVETGEVASSQGAPKYTTKATLQVNVDDALHFKDLDHVEKKHDIEQISAKVLQTKYSVFIQDYGSMTEAPKKVDENGNALQQQNAASKAKKKKVQAEKNVMSSYSAEKLVGHRGDIINDVDKLVEFIGDGGAQNKGGKHRQKQQPDKNAADKGGKKQRAAAQSNKVNKDAAKGGDLKKSNSLEEVSTTKLDGFKFDEDEKEETKGVVEEKRKEEAEKKKEAEPVVEKVEKVKAVKQQPEKSEEAKAKPGKKEEPQQVQEKTKGEAEKAEPKKTEKAEPKKTEKVEPKKQETAQEKPKERKLWDGVESASSLESSATEFRVVTKKKKTKKQRRNSLSGTRHKPSIGASSSAGSGLRSDAACGPAEQRRRTSSPTAPRRKSACSVPHSEKSNDDSSDVDSVHSLPAAPVAVATVGGQPHRRDAPISYADVAKKPEPQKKQFADAKVGRDSASDQGSPKAAGVQPATFVAEPASPAVVTVNAQTQTTPPKAQPPPPPDVSNVRSFPAIGNKVDKGMNTPRPQQPQNRVAQPQQQQLQDRQRVAQCNSANRNVAKVQTVVASSQTCNNVPEQQQQQQQPQQQQQQQPQQQQYRDIKTDLSIIQANEMETIQYNNQIMPRMEIPDVQTIEKLNYMSQPGAHMPLHLQHHVVPPQHLHMAPPPTHYPPPQQQQHRPVVNQPSHHVQMMMQQQPPPDMYHPQQPAYHQNASPTVIVHHTHSFAGSPLQLGFPAQAYEGMAVAYVEHPAFAQQAPPSQAPPQQPAIVANHHQQQQQQHQHHPQQQPQQEKKWADSPESGRPKPKQRRYDKTQGHPDRRKDNNRPPNQQTPIHHQPATNQAVTIYRRGDPAPRTRAEPAATAPPKEDGTCDTANHEIGGDCASSGEEGQQERPPVVILSGGAKDVPGIEFGFAVNPDLVDQEEEEEEEPLPSTPVEIFDMYFKQPAAADAALFNHDKVVHYVGTAWDEVINSGKAQYFSSTPSN